MTKKLIEILKSCPNNQTFLSKIHLRLKYSNFCFYNVFIKLIGNKLLISNKNITNSIIPIDEISLLSFSLSNYTNLEERKINDQYYKYLKEELEPYLLNDYYLVNNDYSTNDYYLDNMWVKLEDMDICLKDCYLKLTPENVCIETSFNSCFTIPINKFSLK